MKRSASFFVFLSTAVWSATLVAAESLVQALFVHVCLVLAALIWRLKVGEQEQVDWYLLPICMLGPLGIVSAVTSYFTWSFCQLDDTDRDAWYDELRGPETEIGARNLANDAAVGRVRPQPCDRPRSAVEIFRKGSFKDRQSILLWIARRRDPSLKSLLLHAMRCDDTIIRSQAASLIVRYQTIGTQQPTQNSAT